MTFTDEPILLLTPDMFKKLPDGTEVISIMGECRVKGDGREFDMDVRYGVMAWGVPTVQRSVALSDEWKSIYNGVRYEVPVDGTR